MSIEEKRTAKSATQKRYRDKLKAKDPEAFLKQQRDAKRRQREAKSAKITPTTGLNEKFKIIKSVDNLNFNISDPGQINDFNIPMLNFKQDKPAKPIGRPTRKSIVPKAKPVREPKIYNILKLDKAKPQKPTGRPVRRSIVPKTKPTKPIKQTKAKVEKLKYDFSKLKNIDKQLIDSMKLLEYDLNKLL